MASPQAASPAATAGAKVSTPTKPAAPDAVSPISNPQPSSAPTPSSPQASIAPVTSSLPITDSPIQHTSISQAAKSIPTSVASPIAVQSASVNSTSHPKSITGTSAKSPVAPPNADTSSSSDASSDNNPPGSSNSMAGPVVGSIFAVLVVIVAVVAGVWYLQRRREKSRMRQEAKRMRSSNFGLYEPGELIHEKRASIEATLEADLARLRNLDVNIPIIVDDYDAKGPQPPTTELSQPFPSLLIARKPSCRVKNSFEVGSLGAAGHHFVPESSANAPGYSQSERAEEYDAYQSPTKATGLYYNLPASALAEKR